MPRPLQHALASHNLTADFYRAQKGKGKPVYPRAAFAVPGEEEVVRTFEQARPLVSWDNAPSNAFSTDDGLT
jgi:hypothetical protein